VNVLSLDVDEARTRINLCRTCITHHSIALTQTVEATASVACLLGGERVPYEEEGGMDRPVISDK
jgi:hypothetical protein